MQCICYRMDSELISKFPFLHEAGEFAEENKVDLSTLVSSPSCEQARIRGVQRIMDSLDHSKVSYVPMVRATEYERLMEVLSYPYAKAVVSVVDDRFLTKRYALSEAVRMNNLLAGEDRSTVIFVSEQLRAPSLADNDGTIRMRFSDYVRLSTRLKSVDWKLINCDVRSGMVLLPQEKFSRLMQNALQDKIESEIHPIADDDVISHVTPDAEMIKQKLLEAKSKFSPTGGEGMKNEFLPPCITNIMRMSSQGLNLPHSARFALVTFLNALGLSYEEIIRVFAESPDFDESKSEYQIKHITGELTGGEGYTPPECATMKTNGLCIEPDSLCQQEWMNHPLSYYRIKSGNTRKKQDEARQRSLLRIHLSEVAPGDYRPLDGRQVADHGEPYHHDLHPAQLEPHDLEGADIELDRYILDYREYRRQDDPIGPAEQSGIEPRSAYRLRLRAHVRSEKNADDREHPEIWVAPCCAEGHTADHKHVRVAVEHVVQIIPLRARFSGQLSDLAVQGVEVSRYYHGYRAYDQQPFAVVVPAEIEYDTA